MQNVIAMGPSENQYLLCDGGSDLIYYVVRNASTSPTVISEWDAKMAKVQCAGCVYAQAQPDPLPRYFSSVCLCRAPLAFLDPLPVEWAAPHVLCGTLFRTLLRRLLYPPMRSEACASTCCICLLALLRIWMR